nr:hypothetical protein [Tanacetum cinerariifolium]
MANESVNRSEERSRSRGEKRPLTGVSESESELSKKDRGSGDEEVRLAANVKKVAEILLVLATMVEMRGGRKASSIEVKMMIEARRKLVEICEVFGPKDVFEKEMKYIRGRMKEKKLVACCPKMLIGEKLEVTKVKVHRMNLVQAPKHEEIAKTVQNIVNAHTPEPDHKTWTVPSTNDCMNKRVSFEMSAIKSESISQEWHCLKFLENSSGKPFPRKYGRCVRKASKPEMSSSTARVQPSTEKKVQSSDGNNNQTKVSSVTDVLLISLPQNGVKLE